MRVSIFDGFSRFTLLLSALVLVLGGAMLGLRPAPALKARDAWVAAIERGERKLPPQRMAHEWRDEISAQEFLLRRDQWLGSVLGGVGLLALVAFGATVRSRRHSMPVT